MAENESLFETLGRVMSPGENVNYGVLLKRLKHIGFDTGGIGMKLAALHFRLYTGAWKGSEFVTYRVPVFDRDAEGDWTDGELRIVRREVAE